MVLSDPLAVAVFGGLVAVLVGAHAGLSYAIVADARARGYDYSVGRGALVAMVWPLAFQYWWQRDSGDPRTTPATTHEHVARAAVVATASAALTGMLLAPPDPATQVVYVTVGTVLELPVAYLLVRHFGG